MEITNYKEEDMTTFSTDKENKSYKNQMYATSYTKKGFVMMKIKKKEF